MARGPSLTITDVAHRVGLSVGRCRALVAARDLPPPLRERGRCYWWAADLAVWKACRAARKRRARRRENGSRPA